MLPKHAKYFQVSPNVAKTRPPNMPLADDWFRGEQAQATLAHKTPG